MKDYTKIIDGLFVFGGGVYGLANIQTLLGVLLLFLQVVWILSKMVITIYQKIKKKEYDEIDDAIKNGADEIEKLKDKLEK